MGWKSFFLGLLLVLLAPLLVVAGVALWVNYANAQPQAGQVTAAVDPQVVWPWQEAAYLLTLHGDRRTDPEPSPPVDIVFMIDVSGSMTSSLPEMSRAAEAVVRDLVAGGDPIRFALVRFDTEAEILIPWTGDPGIFQQGLTRLTSITGGNDTYAAFARLREVLGGARSEARRVVVWYSDGLLDCGSGDCSVMSEDEIAAAGEALREEGAEHYAVSLPYRDAHPLLIRLTGARSRVFEPADSRDLARVFRSLAANILTGFDSGGRLSVQLDGRHFSTPLEGTAWRQESGGMLSLGTHVPRRSLTHALPLEPHSAGLWHVGLAPARLAYVDEEANRLVELNAERRPALLVITWLALFLPILPAFLWAFLYWPRRPGEVAPEPLSLPPIRRPPSPRCLPGRPGDEERKHETVPTLFIGLGGSGRRALQAIRAELREAQPGAVASPFDFLWIDLDPSSDERARELTEESIEAVLAPPEIAQTGSYLPAPGAEPERWAWFDAGSYHDAAREDLNLLGGARGDRALARLALFRWLERGDLTDELRARAEALGQLPSTDGNRQIILVGSRDGGFSSGTFIDFGRLAQRLGRDLQGEDPRRFAPEVLGILCENPEHSRPENREALELELETAMMAGAFPTRMSYGDDDAFLDRIDGEAPFHGLFAVAGADGRSAAAQCAALAAVLVEAQPRRVLLEALYAASPSEVAVEDGEPGSSIVKARALSLHVLPTLVQEQVRLELLLRFLGPDVLLDVEPTADGGYMPKVLPEDEAARRLVAWIAEEPAGGLLQKLLNAVQEPTALSSLEESLERAGDEAEVWLGEALTAAVNRRLHGHREGIAWHRDWTPGATASILRLLGRRLKITAASATQERSKHCLRATAELAEATTRALDDWLVDFCRVCGSYAGERGRLEKTMERWQRLDGRILLGIDDRRRLAEDFSRRALERWLGTEDVLSPLREHLFFAIEEKGAEKRVILRSHLSEPLVFSAAEPFCEHLNALSRSLARGLPASRLGEALSNLEEEERRDLATALVDRASRPSQVVLVTPEAVGDVPREKRVLEAFRHQVPQPADHGERREVKSADRSAVRRLELEGRPVPAVVSAPFVASAEQQAERLRRRIESAYGIEVPNLPPALRIALTQPAAFRSFAQAFRSGHVVLRSDPAGAEEWFFIDGDSFLTRGGADLAAAAADYVFTIGEWAGEFDFVDPGGDFAALERWRRAAGPATRDALVLAAIDLSSS